MTETKPAPPAKPMVVARQMHNKTIILEQLQKAPIVQIACEKTGISRATYYRWRKEYGGMRIDQVRRLKELEQENSRLKKLVADLSLDNAILKEAAEGNF